MLSSKLFLSDTLVCQHGRANCPPINFLPRQFSKPTSEASPVARQESAICFADIWNLATNIENYIQVQKKKQ